MHEDFLINFFLDYLNENTFCFVLQCYFLLYLLNYRNDFNTIQDQNISKDFLEIF